MKNTIIYLIFILSAVLSSAGNNQFLPLVSNFSDSDYGAQLQNWCAEIDDDGIIYIGNNGGLLTFDGYSWECTALPRGTIVRSLLYDNGRLYVGTFEDFGYFERNEQGEMTYISLAKETKAVSLENEEIWQISRLGRHIYFQSFANIFVYEPESNVLSTLPARIAERPDIEGDGNMKPLFSYVICGHLYVQRTNGSFYRFEHGGWRRYWPMKSFGSHIMGVLLPDNAPSAAEEIPDGTLVFTQDHLIYKVSDGRPTPFPTQIDDDIRDCRINRVTSTTDGSIYLGTVGNGLFHIDREGHLLEHFNTSNGLQNNTVLGLCCDATGNIWVTLDDGIALIHAALPFKLLRPGPAGPYLGRSYGVGRLDDRIIIATNQGAYSFDRKGGEFSLIPGSKGQNWYVRTFDGQTFIGGNDRSLIIDRDGTIITEPSSGTDIKKGYINRKEILLQATYYPLRLYQRDEQNRWRYTNEIAGVNAPLRQLEIDADGTVWGAHLTSGLVKLHINSELSGVTEKKFYTTVNGDSIAKRWFIMKIRGKTVFTHGSGFYTYDEISDSFRPAPRLNEDLKSLSSIICAETINDTHFWLACADSYNFVEYDNDRYRLVYSIPMSVFPRKNNGDNSCTIYCGDAVYFTVTDGVGYIDSKIPDNHLDNSSLRVSSIGSLDAHGKLIKLPVKTHNAPELPAANMKVTLSYPNHFRSQYNYRFSMSDGTGNIDSISEVPEMGYSMLSWGHHKLRCGVIDTTGEEIDFIEYEFFVPKPWQLRWWAICLYVVLVLTAIYMLAFFNTRRSVRRRQIEFDNAKAEQDRQIRDQALIIAEQQKRLLESELSTKSKELASMALGAYARQQALDNMRASVADIRRKGSPIGEAERVLKEISTTDGDNRVFWDIFEKNFDLIHEHFFRNLRKAFPTLTPADLKFCALLRMNMSTKEISRFTNLSIRGVETARYRLRKKFNLAPEDKLVQFLIDFKLDETTIQPE